MAVALLTVSPLLAGCADTAGGADVSATSTVTPSEREPLGGPGVDGSRSGQFATVTGVSDGDTLSVEIDGTPEHVRLIGIDTPERGECLTEESDLRVWDAWACGSAPPSTDGLNLSALMADPPGDDNAELNGEWVELTNSGRATVELTGWGMTEESASHRYSFPDGFELAAGASVRVLTGCGSDGGERLHWCSNSALWNNSGDTAFLLDPYSNIIETYRYDQSGMRRRFS